MSNTNTNVSNNGRVDIMGPNTSAVFALQDKVPTGKSNDFRNAMNGNWYETALSRAYFSAANQNIIQNGIRAGVFQMSKGEFVIGPQECDDLQIIMRGVFLQNAQNLPDDIPGQIAKLNKVVLDYAVPQIYGEAISYLKFKRDVSNLASPIDLPVSSYHSNSLQLKPFF